MTIKIANNVKRSVAYTGPGDIVSGWAVWAGLRAYSAATRGTAAIRVVRASDSTQQDIITGSNGVLDTATLTTFLNATTGKIVTIYDQSGNGRNITQGTDASRPAVTLNGINTRTTATFAGSQSLVAADFTQAGPYSLSAVAIRTSAFTTYCGWIESDGSVVFFGPNNVPDTTLLAAPSGLSTGATVPDNVWRTLLGVADTTSSHLYVDGTDYSGSTGATNTTITTHFGIGGAGDPPTGECVEIGLHPSVISGANAAILNANQVAFYGPF